MKKINLILLLLILLCAGFVNYEASAEPNHSVISANSHQSSHTGWVLPTAVVIDYYMVLDHGNSTEEYWQTYVNNIFFQVNMLFQNSEIYSYYRVDHIMVFSDETENLAKFDYNSAGGGEINVTELLYSFSDFVDANSTLNGYEEVQLLSGSDFSGGNIGLAWTGNPDYNGPSKSAAFYPRSVVQATFSDSYVAKISAHEIAHNYSAVHDGDGNNCNTSNYLMYYQLNDQTQFSSCSVSELNYFLDKWFADFEDTTVPHLSDIANFDIEEQSGVNYTLNWDVSDDNLGFYDVYVDGVLQVGDQIIDTAQIIYNISLEIEADYNITIVVRDFAGHIKVDEVLMSVGGDLTPIITGQTGDLTILENETVHVEFNVTDDGNTSLFEFYENSILIDSVNFTSFISYNYTITDFAPGTYNYTIVVTDEIDQTRVSTVIITVEEIVIETSTSAISETSGSSDTSSSDSTSTVTNIVTEVVDETTTISDSLSSSSEDVIDSILSSLGIELTFIFLSFILPLSIRMRRKSN